MKNFFKNILDISDPRYPQYLRNTYQPPERLYCIGDISLLMKTSVAFVGTRKSTPYGKFAVEKLIEDLSLCDVVIVSGLARGIDTIAHENAILNGLKTIAILGTSLDKIYPSENENLAKRILSDGGCIVTEYDETAFPAGKFSFPMRNRIIAGLCSATVVVEAPRSSGALITAKRAFEENREVFAVPGDIDRDESVGCNNLIRQLVAKPVTTGADIIRELKIQPNLFSGRVAVLKLNQENHVRADFEEYVQAVYSSIPKTRSVNIDRIIENSKVSPRDVNKALSILEIYGFITMNEYGFYVRIAP